MSTTDDTEASVNSEVPVGNPDEVAKNPTALKEAYQEMAIIDILVCGSCHNVFHFVKEFEEHKEQGCTGESPIKDINEREAQIWAFLLWKCSSSGEAGHNNSWRLYQQWCRMAAPHRNAWLAAGTNVLSTSKFSHATLTETTTEDQLVPIQSANEKKRGRPKKHKLDDSDGPHRSGEESDISSPMKKPNINRTAIAQNLNKLKYEDSVRNAQERVPPEERVARRTERGDSSVDSGEYIVEKILAKRFNPRTKQYEYLLKWEGYPHEQNTWEPVDNMETCKNLLAAFEKQLARQKELKALRAQLEQQGGQQPVKVKQAITPVAKTEIRPKADSPPTYTPTGRLQRSSKARALDQVKAWCGATDDEPSGGNKVKKEVSSDDEDYTDSEGSKEDSPVRTLKSDKKTPNSTQKSNVDPELVKKLGLGGKGMPNIKGVIKVDPKQIPNLSSGVYIMSKSSGIIKIDSPGKSGTNIDQDTIRKQILAAKQKKAESEQKSVAKTAITPKKPGLGQHITEKTIITPSGQKIIQRTIQRTTASPNTKSPVTSILNKKMGMANDSLLRRGGTTPRGRGRAIPPGYSITTANGNVIRVREKNPDASLYESDAASSDTSDGITDPFPAQWEPIPPPSPPRGLTLCPHTGRRLARAEGEPTPPPTPPAPPTPSPPASPASTEPVIMKVEMSPGGTTGMLVAGDAPSLPVLTDDEGSEVKVEANAVKQLLEDGVEDGEEVSLLHGDHNTPIMIRGEDGVLYQVTGENEEGQTVLVPAEGVEGTADGEEVMYVTREDSSDVLSLDPAQLAQLVPGGAGAAGLQQVTVQVEGEPGEDATQVIAQLVQVDLPSPGGTRRAVLLLPDGSLTMTDLDKEQYDSITGAAAAE